MSQPDRETARLIDQEAEYAEATRDDPYPPGVIGERRNRARSSVDAVTSGLSRRDRALAALRRAHERMQWVTGIDEEIDRLRDNPRG